MNIDRRQLALPALAIGLLGVVPAFAASADEDAVAKSVEAFRAAQVAADAKALDALCAAELSYSHSDARVEDKATFIANATNGKSKFLSLAYQDPKIRVVGTAAIVRFHWVGESQAVADGKKSSTNLHILMNWQKQGADWKLLSRVDQALIATRLRLQHRRLRRSTRRRETLVAPVIPRCAIAHLRARVKRASPESITTIGSMDSGPAPSGASRNDDRGKQNMKQIRIGDITIDAVIEREGPWRRPQDFFPAYDEAVFKRHLPSMEPEVFDQASGMMVITYQTFVVRTPRHTILVDTCTGEDKGHPPPFDFPGKERWRNELFALGIAYDKVDYVFCTHLHIDHTGWNTTLRDGRWVPTFPNAKYVFHKKEYAAWEAEHARGANPPGTVFRDNCLPVVEAGQALLVDDDYALDDTITLTPTPGHSPCHCCVNIFSAGSARW